MRHSAISLTDPIFFYLFNLFIIDIQQRIAATYDVHDKFLLTMCVHDKTNQILFYSCQDDTISPSLTLCTRLSQKIREILVHHVAAYDMLPCIPNLKTTDLNISVFDFSK